MGNAELRLTLADIKSEQAELKRIAIDTHDQAARTNGKVMWLTKLAWLCMGAFPLLTIWSGWLTKEVLDLRKDIPSESQQAIAVQLGVSNALAAYEEVKK